MVDGGRENEQRERRDEMVSEIVSEMVD